VRAAWMRGRPRGAPGEAPSPRSSAVHAPHARIASADIAQTAAQDGAVRSAASTCGRTVRSMTFAPRQQRRFPGKRPRSAQIENVSILTGKPEEAVRARNFRHGPVSHPVGCVFDPAGLRGRDPGRCIVRVRPIRRGGAEARRHGRPHTPRRGDGPFLTGTCPR